MRWRPRDAHAAGTADRTRRAGCGRHPSDRTPRRRENARVRFVTSPTQALGGREHYERRTQRRGEGTRRGPAGPGPRG
ncbi:protein of unknown function [Microbacterium sp. Nx66]|nr:protein of unknown function [Microbacterium sp. Nx66]